MKLGWALQILAGFTFLLLGSIDATKAASPEKPTTSPPCSALVTKDGAITLVPLPNLNTKKKDAPLVVPKFDGELGSVVCQRSTVVPEPTDYRFFSELSVPLFIKQGDRTLILEMVNGRIQVRMPQGEMKNAEARPLQSRINELQKAFDKMSDKH
jgi:hypothetical protein